MRTRDKKIVKEIRKLEKDYEKKLAKLEKESEKTMDPKLRREWKQAEKEHDKFIDKIFSEQIISKFHTYFQSQKSIYRGAGLNGFALILLKISPQGFEPIR